MNRPHPASLILLGGAVLFAASSREGPWLFMSGLAPILAALLAAPSHLVSLLRRSRWLMLVMLVMFGWMTPGTPLPLTPGATHEGLLLAAENLVRLLIALSVVALILQTLRPPALVAGMRSLLAPLALLNISRDRIAVRLALTLNEVEASRSGPNADSRPFADSLALPASVVGATDVVLGLTTAALAIGAWLR